MFDDQALRESVMAELEWEPRVNAAHIGVAVKEGVVTLSGIVDSFAEKAAAERAVGRVRGVRAIAEEIEVRLPSEQKHGDEEIAERALRILAWDIEVPHERLKVKVERGIVTLTGEVPRWFQREAAAADIRRLGGVLGVVNLVQVTPQHRGGADADVVRQKIEAALRRNAEMEAEGVRVEVSNGTVTLRGSVRTWAERAVAESAAWAAPGVQHVSDELHVRP